MNIWAEAGACEGDIEYAKKAARAVHAAGASALKVQWLHPDLIFSQDAVRYDHTPGVWVQQADGYKDIIYPYTDWLPVVELCEELGIGFIPAVFDSVAVNAAYEMGIGSIKIASGDITNEQLIRTVAKGGFPQVTLSTGGATMDEVERAVKWIRDGSESTSILLLACHLEYPTEVDEAHLGRIVALRDYFPQLDVGYSDHTSSIEVTPLVLCLGAQVLEKHFTLDKDIGVADHSFAVDSDELAEMVKLVEFTLTVVDNVALTPSAGEMAALTGARRSLYAARDIEAGSKIEVDDLRPLRPYNSEHVDAADFTDTVGMRAFVDIAEGQPVGRKMVGKIGASLSVS